MMRLDSLWQTLESRRDLAAVEIEWKRWLGDTFDAIAQFLDVDADRSAGYPRCIERNGMECACNVVPREKNRFLAVCEFEDPEFPPISLQRKDVLVHQFMVSSFVKHLAAVCGFDGVAGDGVPGILRVWTLGSIGIRPGIRALAYFVLPDYELGYQVAFGKLLAARVSGPVMLVVPSLSSLPDRDLALLEPRRAHVISASELLTLDEDDTWLPHASAVDIGRSLWPQTTTFIDTSDGQETIAVAFTNETPAGERITRRDVLERLRSQPSAVQHFVDAIPARPFAVCECTGRPVRAELTAAEMSVLAAFLIRAAEGKTPFRPRDLRLDMCAGEGARKAFDTMRRKVDVRLDGQKYRLFQQRRDVDRGPSRYEFSPLPDTTYCFLFAPGSMDEIRSALKSLRS